ncbi:MAG: RnfABCDGE type electron transport complex subunit A [Clostridia bacterium]|nr:RnfABCDGE type electron transport complex subunit A [Clostridia bacterium]
MILHYITIAFTAMLAENFVLVKIMGICPFLGVSKKINTAMGMGMAVLFVILLSSIFTWLVQLALNALGLAYLQTIAFILVIASLVQFVETVMKKYLPALYKSLGIYLPLITTNCAVLGSAILIQTNGYNLAEAIVFAIFASLGFTLAIVIFAGIRERLEESDIPEFMKGLPISLVSASLLSLAFLGFQGFSF